VSIIGLFGFLLRLNLQALRRHLRAFFDPHREPEPMAEILALRDAVKRFVNDGDTVALEGFTHLIPSLLAMRLSARGART